MLTKAGLLQPISIGNLEFRNRVAVAPMTRTSARADGTVGPLMRDYYAAFARGGYGLIITEGTYTDLSFSHGYRNQPGIATSAHAESWRGVVDAVHAAGARIILQLMHAGALAQHNPYRQETIGPSAVQPKGEQMSFYEGVGPYPRARAITLDEIAEVVATFAESAIRAKQAGFDGVEIHGANGYLLDQFLTSYTNSRDDDYGGETRNRIRLTEEIARAIRKAVGPNFTVGVRISQAKVNDFTHKWEHGDADAKVIFSALAETGIDYLHTTEFRALAPAFGEGRSLAALAKRYSGLPVIANGSLHDVADAEQIVYQGVADFVALGRGALANADWPRRLRDKVAFRKFEPEIIQPVATIQNANAYLSSANGGRAEDL